MQTTDPLELTFRGVLGEPERDGCFPGRVTIGGIDFIDDILESFDRTDVWLNGKLIASGASWSQLSWGYSEYTWMEGDEWKVGDCDVLAEIEAAGEGGIEVELVVRQHNEPRVWTKFGWVRNSQLAQSESVSSC